MVWSWNTCTGFNRCYYIFLCKMSDGFSCTWHSITVRCRLIFVVNRAEHILRISISKFMWIKMFSCSKATKLVTYQIESTTDKCLSNRKIVHARTQCAFVSSFEEWKLHRNREKLTKSVSCAHYAWFVSDNGTQRRKNPSRNILMNGK